MNLNVDNFLNFGPALCLGLAAIGSSIGCGLAGMTSHGAMAKVEEGHAKFVALSAMPASQSIYGFALMILLQQALKTDPSKGFAIFGIGEQKAEAPATAEPAKPAEGGNLRYTIMVNKFENKAKHAPAQFSQFPRNRLFSV